MTSHHGSAFLRSGWLAQNRYSLLRQPALSQAVSSVDGAYALRPVLPSEGDVVEALTRRIWTGRVGASSTVFRETAETVRAQIERGGGVLMTHAGETVGSGRWVPVPGPGGGGLWMEAKRIGVLPEHTGQGLGARLLAALEDLGRSAGCAGCQLAVRSDQPRLVGYYVALGYSEADDVDLTTMNPLEPPPFGMRKVF